MSDHQHITVLGTPNCQGCGLTVRALEKAGLTRGSDYVYRDVTSDPEAAALAKSLGYATAPVLIAGDKNWSGFRPDLLNDAIAAAVARKTTTHSVPGDELAATVAGPQATVDPARAPRAAKDEIAATIVGDIGYGRGLILKTAYLKANLETPAMVSDESRYAVEVATSQVRTMSGVR